MKNLLILVVGLALGAAGFWLASRSAHHGEEAEEPRAAEEISHTAGLYRLSADEQKAAGIRLQNPEPAVLPGRVKGYGRALDPAPIISLKLDVDAARAALDASRKEFDRVKTLFAQNQNASARALESAEATLKRDETQLNLAEARLQTTLGRTLAHREDLPTIFEQLLNMTAVLVRFDLIVPPPSPLPKQVLLAPIINETNRFEGELLGPAPAAEAMLQGQGFLGLLKTNVIAPNMAVVVWLEDSSRTNSGFIVPNSAVLQEGAGSIVFVEGGNERFKKVPVDLGFPVAEGAFVTSGLVASNRVVVEGAHQILSMTRLEPAE